MGKKYQVVNLGGDDYAVIDTELQQEVCVVNDYDGRIVPARTDAVMIASALTKYEEEEE